MASVVFRGPGPEVTFMHKGRRVTFEAGNVVEVDQEFADELIGKAPDLLFDDGEEEVRGNG
jgi:hypothetical protein